MNISREEVICVMDSGDGAAFVYLDDKKAGMIPIPVVGHWLKKLRLILPKFKNRNVSLDTGNVIGRKVLSNTRLEGGYQFAQSQ